MDRVQRDRNKPPPVPENQNEVPRYRPTDRFWPYVDLPELPTDEELATLDPDLREALFGPERRAFSLTIVFPRLDHEDYARALEIARSASDYQEIGSGESIRHRARFHADQALKLRDLWQIVGRYDDCEVLVDDRPLPYARELWLPLFWFLIRR